MKDKDICIVEGCENIRDKKQNRRICQMHRTRYSRYKSYDLPEKEKLPNGIVKICKIHGELTELDTYKTDSYIWPQCLACKKISNDKFKARNPNRDTNSIKKYFYVKKGNIKLSKDEYQNMLIKQNYVCAICSNPENAIKANSDKIIKRLSIDHCHSTNKIRGLLCNKCNISLGLINESLETLQAAIANIKNNKIYLSGLGHFPNCTKTLQSAIEYIKKHQ
jgi:hypothetical protein